MPRTLFILGAGASFPYNFPLGLDLINSIDSELQLVENRPAHIENLTKLLKEKFDEVYINDFHQLLIDSELDSIDYFLTINEEFLEIGKACISYVILKHEKTFAYKREFGGNWYRYLYNELAGVDKGKFDFKIYTFNYDRSLENYFSEKVKSAFHNNKAKQDAFIKSIPICHLHGSLGHVKFGGIQSVKNYGTLEMISSSIKIISEVEIDENFGALKKDINGAEHILLLGFGFHHDNMKRIGEKNIAFRPSRTLYATTKGLKSAEIKSKFYRKVAPSIPTHSDKYIKGHLKYADSDCLEFLREHFEFSNLFKKETF